MEQKMENQEYLTTSEFVEPLKVKDATARRAFCVNGHYMGAVPKKLPNNRLLWAEQDQQRILNGVQAGAE